MIDQTASKQITRFMNAFLAEVDQIYSDASKRVVNGMLTDAPVDEGEYRSQWNFALNARPTDARNPFDTTKTGARSKRRIKPIFEDMTLDDILIGENDDSAAIPIEFGGSDQAPGGVLRKHTRRWKRYVRQASFNAQRRARRNVADGVF
jgi:hypothetical protein